jgi:hypothetical protein
MNWLIIYLLELLHVTCKRAQQSKLRYYKKTTFFSLISSILEYCFLSNENCLLKSGIFSCCIILYMMSYIRSSMKSTNYLRSEFWHMGSVSVGWHCFLDDWPMQGEGSYLKFLKLTLASYAKSVNNKYCAQAWRQFIGDCQGPYHDSCPYLSNTYLPGFVKRVRLLTDWALEFLL